MHSSRAQKILARIEERKGPRETPKSTVHEWTAEEIENFRIANYELFGGGRRPANCAGPSLDAGVNFPQGPGWLSNDVHAVSFNQISVPLESMGDQEPSNA